MDSAVRLKIDTVRLNSPSTQIDFRNDAPHVMMNIRKKEEMLNRDKGTVALSSSILPLRLEPKSSSKNLNVQRVQPREVIIARDRGVTKELTLVARRLTFGVT